MKWSLNWIGHNLQDVEFELELEFELERQDNTCTELQFQRHILA